MKSVFRCIPVGPLQANCYLIGCAKTYQTIIVDPGGDFELIRTEIEGLNLNPVKIINTHAHIDHMGAVSALKRHYRIQFGLHRNDLPVLKSVPLSAQMFGLNGVEIPEVDFHFKENDLIKAGEVTLKVLETPGHTKGSVCFLGSGFLISGDTLFQGSIGRTDLPGGSYDEIISSIRRKVFTLEDSTEIYPGHGPKTSVREEQLYNPFFKDSLEST